MWVLNLCEVVNGVLSLLTYEVDRQNPKHNYFFLKDETKKLMRKQNSSYKSPPKKKDFTKSKRKGE